jgi:ribose/xylose/arabinose/galactoside ABC-type transport system permease subunit
MKPLGVSWSFFIMVAFLLIMEVVIKFTTIGRKIKAVGGNKEAALMAGVHVVKIKWGVYVLSGFTAGGAGILTAISMMAASPDFGAGLEFRTITACVVGGISLVGGQGSMLSLGIGILFVNVLTNCLQFLRVDTNWQLVATGIVLVICVIFDNAKRDIRARSI